METHDNGKLKDGSKCKVVGGTRAGRLSFSFNLKNV
jgi:hypothetical protein